MINPFVYEVSSQERERRVSHFRNQTCFSAGSLKVSALEVGVRALCQVRGRLGQGEVTVSVCVFHV